MPKLRKQRRSKKYRYNVNRKRLRNRINKKGNIPCKEMKEAWDERISVKRNIKEMGLSYDPNETIRIPKSLNQLKVPIPSNNEDEWHEEVIETEVKPTKIHVAEALEADAKAPREKNFRLPKSQVRWLTYLMDKYGDDYEAMARDKKNYYQETWKQLRAKINRFKAIPEQYNEYLARNE